MQISGSTIISPTNGVLHYHQRNRCYSIMLYIPWLCHNNGVRCSEWQMVCTKHTVQTRKSYKGLTDVAKDISSESGYVTLKTRIALGTSLKLGV